MTALPPGDNLRDLRGSSPDSSGLTWRFVAICLPVVFIAYFACIAIVRTFFLAAPYSIRSYTPIGFVLVLVPMSVMLLRPFMLRKMGVGKQAEKREQVWTKSYEIPKLAARQAARYLAVALPVETLGMLSAGVAVSLLFRVSGLSGN